MRCALRGSGASCCFNATGNKTDNLLSIEGGEPAAAIDDAEALDVNILYQSPT